MTTQSFLRSITIAAAAVVTLPVFAGQVARVVSSTPAYDTVSNPVQVCGYETQQVAGQASGSGGAVLGAIAGGLLGHNAAGNNGGRKTATIAGAIAGGFIGNEIAPSQSNATQIVQTKVCHQEFTSSQVIAGYDVTYEYQGMRNVARLSQAPGPYINVDVAVRPSANQ
jgi:uncharacterized protein YcfJ